MKYIIFGFYNHDNIGDEMFKAAFTNLFPTDNLTFWELSDINNVILENFDAVIVGGGDLLNDFYGIKYTECLQKYTGYKIALGVGVSFESCLEQKYLTYFDDIVLRNKKDLNKLNKQLGSSHSHSISDLGFSLPINLTEKEKTGKKIGLLLVGSLINNTRFMFDLLSLVNWFILLDYTIELIPMYTEKDIPDNDLVINKHIYETFKHSGKIINHDNLSVESFLDILSYMDYAVCIRYHGHVFCTRLNIPYLSIPITRKDQIYQEEIDLDNTVKLFRDTNYEVFGFDLDNAKDIFQNIVKNKESVKETLKYKNRVNAEFYNSGKIQTLVKNKKKRYTSSFYLNRISPNDIYIKYRNIFLERGINPFTDTCTDISWLHSLADEMCYELTLDAANDYLYGTRINLETRLNTLKDMIYYIYYDNLSKVNIPKINMNFIKQDSFKGLHRAGWQYAINSLYPLSNDNGIFLDTYMDRTFGWAENIFKSSGVLPYTNYWIGFVHHTFDIEFSSNNCTNMFNSLAFKQSLPLCRGIFCMTEYLAKQIRDLNLGVKVEVLSHPTIFPSNKFSFDRYIDNKNKRLINIGSWYRNPIVIHTLDKVENITYSSLKGKRMESNFCPSNVPITRDNDKLICNVNIWTKYFVKYLNKDKPDLYHKIMLKLDKVELIDIIHDEDFVLFLNKVEILSTLDDQTYDNLLTCNLVFLNLIDASVANTIIECIVRHTPILVNRIPPTVELLGENYPFFYDKVEEIPSLLNDETVKNTYEYLRNMDSEKYRIDSFFDSFINSSIYKNI